ncbi:MAG: D-alanyl-D-alanine carboxypeptidase [Rhizobiaceae bacterium]|jgi:D-alanyl-D-alanine carboxypeptidase (penicillin-binding protein 5/6)|nr:D-alanyl-D-alanine carboxypeptidase [Rhizobiaceae bacterium]
MATLSPPRIVFHLAAILVTAVFMLSALQQAQAQIYSTPAEAALLMDAETGTVLFSKNPDTRIPPASLAKIMTMEVVFDQLKRGKLKLDDRFFVSENAWRNGGASSGGSTMFAKLNSEIRLEDLIRGVVIQSANDGSIIIAEGLAGSEQAFANLMNQRARQIGLDASNFTNSTGLPDPEQYVTIRDLAKLARYIIREYPNYYRYYREKDFEWNNIRQRNRNPLLASNIGADGMKTGYTEESGYGIVGTAKREGRRLVAVLSGMTSKSQRAEEARKILDWGFRAFEKITLFEEGEILGQASVYGGEKPGVDVVGEGPVSIYLPIGYRDKMKARIVYTGPLMPPVAKGSQIASLKVWIDDELSQETKLYAAEDVNKGGLQRQAVDALKELLFGWL